MKKIHIPGFYDAILEVKSEQEMSLTVRLIGLREIKNVED